MDLYNNSMMHKLDHLLSITLDFSPKGPDEYVFRESYELQETTKLFLHRSF